MHLKKFLLFGLIAAILPAVAEEAADRKTATSLNYVEHELDTRQNKFTAEANKAMEYTNTAGDVQKRTVKSDLGSDTTDTSLPMVGGVNTKLNQKQDDIAAVNDHTAVTYTGQPGGIGQKGIYQTTGTYAEQADNLIDAKTFNAALKTGLDREFKCRDYKPDTDLCWVYSIHNTVGNGLPDGYTELEYIESDGTQYIDTGIKIKATQSIETKIAIKDVHGTGWMGSISSVSNLVRFGHTSPNIYAQRPFTGGVRLAADTNFHTYKASLTENSIDDTSLATTVTADQTINFYLFAQNDARSDGISSWLKAKISSFKVWENSEVIMNMVPARHGTAVGMYDTVSQQFFPNLGDGDDFTAGPTVTVFIPENQ